MEWQGYLHSLAPWEPEVAFREGIGDAESFKEFLKTLPRRSKRRMRRGEGEVLEGKDEREGERGWAWEEFR
jgi:hypothetical protein